MAPSKTLDFQGTSQDDFMVQIKVLRLSDLTAFEPSLQVPRLIRDLSSLQPLLHALVFLVEMAIISRMVAKFNSYYAEKPGISTFSWRGWIGY
jgi:hypothetical protein